MKAIIAGDLAPQARLAKQIKVNKYGDVFPEDICGIVKSADFSFVNLESPIIKDGFKPIQKCGPNMHCICETAEAVRYAGFTGVTLANNHILDFGPDGLHYTIECCSAQRLDIVGVGENLNDAGNVLYLEKDGETLAVINCCEHEFSIASDTTPGANPLDPIRQFYAIQEAKEKADYVLVIVHGGHEHFRLPSLRMVATYRFFIDVGADAVVNHHQHCFSGSEVYHGKPIYYGLGNFCFDLDERTGAIPWNYGFMLEIEFGHMVQTRIYPYCQYGDQPNISLLDSHAFDEEIEKLNSIISNPDALRKEVGAYYKRFNKFEFSLLEPYDQSRVLNKLFNMGLLPKVFKGYKKNAILNHIMCESHRDKLVFALTENQKDN